MAQECLFQTPAAGLSKHRKGLYVWLCVQVQVSMCVRMPVRVRVRLPEYVRLRARTRVRIAFACARARL